MIRIQPVPIPILTYHQIEEAPPRGAQFRSLYVSPGAFAGHMAMLSALGYQGLGMAALVPYLKGEKTGKVVGITLDDGYLNNLTQALPTLQRHGFSATCYFVSHRLGRTNDWDRDLGVAQVPLMNAAQMREWRASGQEVGAHSRNHARLMSLGAAAAREEIAYAKSELEHLTGHAVQHFCYPFGEFEDRHVHMVAEAGYLTATTTQRGRAQATDDFLQLPRVPVLRSTTRLALWLKLATGYEDRRRT